MFRYTSQKNSYSVNLIVQVFLMQDEIIFFSLFLIQEASSHSPPLPRMKKKLE